MLPDQTARRRGRGSPGIRPSAAGAAISASLVLLGGCAAPDEYRTEAGSRAIHVVYEAVQSGGEGGDVPMLLDVVVAAVVHVQRGQEPNLQCRQRR